MTEFATTNGAEALMDTLAACGLRRVFANPGTSEMHLVAALDRRPEMAPILCLHENVATGAADGYGRIAEAPAGTLLHLGPGLGNGWSNLHNARRAGTPVLNIVGDHAEDHLRYDAPLTSDLASLAGTASHFVKRARSAATAPADAALAYREAMTAPGRISTLILPADAAWNACAGPAAPAAATGPSVVDGAVVDRVAAALRAAQSKGEKAALLVRGAGLRGRGLEAASRIAAKTGAILYCDTFAPRLARGVGVPHIERLPYFAEQIVEALEGLSLMVMVQASPPVSFFAYPGKPSWCLPEGCDPLYLAHPHEDSVGALEALAEALDAGGAEPQRAPAAPAPAAPSGKLDPIMIGSALVAHMPENAILVDEAATSGLFIYPALAAARPHDHLNLTGGSIGWGLPAALGAAVAAPDRKVVCLHGDGGSMYSIQALWSMARENADVLTIIMSNRAYAILQIELSRVGAVNPGPKAHSTLDLTRPELDFVSLAQGMGVEASRAETGEAFWDQVKSAMAARGPRLIEAML